MMIKNIYRTTHILLWLLLLVSEIIFGQNVYKVIGNAFYEDFYDDTSTSYSNFKTYDVENFTGAFDSNHDGFMIDFHVRVNPRLSTSYIMALRNGTNSILTILNRNKKIVLKRYDTDGERYIEYPLFDQLMPVSSYNGAFDARFRIHFSANFIWVQMKWNQKTTPGYNSSPVLWGLNIPSRDAMTPFLQKSSGVKISVKKERIAIGSESEAYGIIVYGFNTENLIKNINQPPSAAVVARQTAKGEVQKGFMPVFAVDETVDETKEQEKEAKELLVQKGFTVYPNPVKDQLFITLSNNKKNRIELLDLQGRLLYHVETNGVYKHTILLKKLPVKGVFLIRCILDGGIIETKKLVR